MLALGDLSRSSSHRCRVRICGCASAPLYAISGMRSGGHSKKRNGFRSLNGSVHTAPQLQLDSMVLESRALAGHRGVAFKSVHSRLDSLPFTTARTHEPGVQSVRPRSLKAVPLGGTLARASTAIANEAIDGQIGTQPHTVRHHHDDVRPNDSNDMHDNAPHRLARGSPVLARQG